MKLVEMEARYDGSCVGCGSPIKGPVITSAKGEETYHPGTKMFLNKDNGDRLCYPCGLRNKDR